MMVKEIDCRGLNCPQPVINTKKALEEISTGRVTTIVDNPVAHKNVSLFARNSGHRVEDKEENGVFYITITKASGKSPQSEPTQTKHSQPITTQNLVYLVSSNCFGQGSPDLGNVLMKSLMLTLSESDPAPEALVFLNTGVYLAAEGSDVLPYLNKLSDSGTSIMACGTCLDYYRLREKLAVGQISNMYEINNILTGPNKVITVS